MGRKSPYQIVFSDVDGTLLNQNRELSELTIQQIQRITNKYNVKFVMVSARMPEGMKYLYDQLSFESPMICYNGALILKKWNGKFDPKNIIHSNSIDLNTIRQLYNKVKDEGLHFGVFSNNYWYANKHDEWTKKEEHNTRVKCTISPNIEELISELEKNQSPIHKIMIMGESSKIESALNFSNANFSEAITNYRPKVNYIEVTPKCTNKANGCIILMDYLGIEHRNSIAFGDNFNDIEMLRMAGIGIAVENAHPQVKENATQTTQSNLNDGVAVSLIEIYE